MQYYKLTIKFENPQDKLPFYTVQYKQIISLSDYTPTSSENLSVMYLNARSLRNKIDYINTLIKSLTTKIHAVVVTEHWLHDEETQFFNLDNYNAYYLCRKNKDGGGVAVFVHTSIVANPIRSIDAMVYGIMLVELQLTNNVIIGGVYRNDTEFNLFIDEYDSVLENLRHNSLLLGDLNLDLKSTHRGTIKRYIDTIDSNNFAICNSLDISTRETDTTSSIIDHAIANQPSKIRQLSYHTDPELDHKILIVDLADCRESSPKSNKTEYNRIDYDMLRIAVGEAVKNCDKTTKDVDIRYNKLVDSICNAMERSTIKKKCSVCKKRQPWVSRQLIDLIKERDKTYKRMKRMQHNLNLQENFRELKKRVQDMVKKDKSSYYEGEFTKANKNSKKTWSIINSLLFNKKKTQGTVINKLENQGTMISDPKEICNAVNDYFTSIGQELANKFDGHQADSTLSYTAIHSMFLTPVSRSEVINIILSLKSCTSAGYDGITPKVIKTCHLEIVEELVNIINLSFETGKIPDPIKVARITPIYKSGTKSDCGNYRPISVLPVLSKIFERAMLDRLQAYLSKINYITANQYGFKQKSNTEIATVDLVTDLQKQMDNNNHVLGLFIDFKKAFDTVNHSILLDKLYKIGVRGTPFLWLRDYLTNRKQFVHLGFTKSDFSNVSYGVPQGSILGPTLFSVYINDIVQCGAVGSIKLYADDTNVFYYGSDVKRLFSDAQSDIYKIVKWCTNNKLTINELKTNYIVFCKPSTKSNDDASSVTLSINNNKLCQVEKVKYLGLMLDRNLNWEAHIDYTVNKIRPFIKVLQRISRQLNFQTKMLIYFAYVYSRLMYLNVLWCTAKLGSLHRIQVLQNKAIRVIYQYNRFMSVIQMYKPNNMLTLDMMFKYSTVNLWHKISINAISTTIKAKQNCEIHKYNTRSARNSHLQHVNSMKYGSKSFTYRGAKLYNEVPISIRNLGIKAFKLNYKKYLLSLP